MEAKIISTLAGRAAELEFSEDISAGAADDFQKAYKIAYNMVTKLGMSNLGHVSL